MSTSNELAGKVVVVTGSGRGIGKEIAIGAGKQGASIALVEVISSNLNSAVEDISKIGINVKGYLTDLSDESQVLNNFAQIEKDFGKIDCLVNNAMIHYAEDLISTSLDTWNKSLAVTLIRIEAVFYPLPYISEHIEDAKLIGFIGTHIGQTRFAV